MQQSYKPAVLVAILNQGNICTELAFMLPRLLSDNRLNVSIRSYTHRPISHNRNLIAQEFLKERFDYLMMIDEDIIPPANILDLITFDKDIIGGVCPIWKENDLMWVVMNKVTGGYKQVSPEERKGLREVDAIGTGCIAIKREALEAVKAPFVRKWNEEGLAILGQDLNFCAKAKDLGFKVWAHWDYICGHKKEIDLKNIYNLIARING